MLTVKTRTGMRAGVKGPAYPIRAVAKLTGLSIDTLRAWERRYKAISPNRAGRGRTYNEADIKRLQLLREAVDKGHRIGEMAALSDQELRDLMSRSSQLAVRAAHMSLENSAQDHLDVSPVLDRIDRFDPVATDRELARLAALVTPRDFVYRVVVPLMIETGDRWYKGDFSVAQEHMVSAILRSLLGALVRVYQSANTPATLLFATPNNEQHEFGILAAAMLAAGNGLGVVYLGISLPAEEILSAVEKTSPKAVVLGTKGTIAWSQSLRDLQTIARGLPSGTELWVGGVEQQGRIRELKQFGAVSLKDLAQYEGRLTRLAALPR